MPSASPYLTADAVGRCARALAPQGLLPKYQTLPLPDGPDTTHLDRRLAARFEREDVRLVLERSDRPTVAKRSGSSGRDELRLKLPFGTAPPPGLSDDGNVKGTTHSDSVVLNHPGASQLVSHPGRAPALSLLDPCESPGTSGRTRG